jgi:type IV pilus assembly protein PilE
MEVMITVAIVAILASIAMPAYQDYIRRGQVQEAPSNLSDFRVRMEQFYQDSRSYSVGGNCGAPLPAGRYFNYACAIANGGQAYTATANGIGLTAGLAYTVDQVNNQQTTCTGCAWNFAGTQTTWVVKKP